MSEAELARWAAGAGRQLWTFRVVDRFGDAGLTGLLGLEKVGAEVHVADFVLSCRVMGRQIEEAILHWALEAARRLGGTRLLAEYLPTARNKPCLDLFARLFGAAGPRFCRDVRRPLPLPAHVHLHV